MKKWNMKKWKMAVVGGFVAIALAVITVPAAYATNEVNFVECLFNGEYFTIGMTWDNGLGSRRCFANRGDLWIDQGRVTGFSSGNNAGWFDYEPGDGWLYRHYFKKWENWTANYITITTLHID